MKGINSEKWKQRARFCLQIIRYLNNIMWTNLKTCVCINIHFSPCFCIFMQKWRSAYKNEQPHPQPLPVLALASDQRSSGRGEWIPSLLAGVQGTETLYYYFVGATRWACEPQNLLKSAPEVQNQKNRDKKKIKNGSVKKINPLHQCYPCAIFDLCEQRRRRWAPTPQTWTQINSPPPPKRNLDDLFLNIFWNVKLLHYLCTTSAKVIAFARTLLS